MPSTYVDGVATLLQELRRREARRRGGAVLSYRQLAARTGWSVAAVGTYLTGTRLPSRPRLTQVAILLGADEAELAALLAARERDGARARAIVGRDAAELAPVARTLPAAPAGFTGRATQLAVLDRLLACRTAMTPVAISAITGMGGVGKTALAVHWAHRVAHAFPGGQLYIDLHGYDRGSPLSTMDALAALLSSLDLAPASQSPELAGRRAQMHRLMRGRRSLVVLDNASDAEQVMALLPPPPCVALVTSRDGLTELIAGHGATGVTLDVLPESDALALLRLLIGERARRELQAAKGLAQRCGYLPLALRVAAEHVASHPKATLSDLLAELAEEAPLDAIASKGDARSDARTVFSWSLGRLPEEAVHTFRLLGLHPGSHVDMAGLAALTASEPEPTRLVAETLSRAHLVSASLAGRISMHDLLRAFAAESCERLVSADERRAAVDRLLEHYVTRANAAVDLQYPLSRSTRPAGGSSTSRQAVFENVRAAAAWMSVERANLVRLCVLAAHDGWPGLAIALALVLRPYLDDNAHYQDAMTVHSAAMAAVQSLGRAADPAERASVRGCLGVTNWRLGRLNVAARQLAAAAEENLRAGHGGGASFNLAVLGLVHDARGRYHEALECQRRGLAVARSAGIAAQVGSQLINVAYAHVRLGQHDVAEDGYQQALAFFESRDQPWGLAQARYGLSMALQGLGRNEEALAQAQMSLALNRSFGQVIGCIRVIAVMGSVLRRLGRHADAVDQLGSALRECRDSGNPRPTSQVLNALAESHHDTGDHARALACHAEAYDIADRGRDWAERVRALVGMGDAHAGAGDMSRARRCWHRAQRAHAGTGLPTAALVQARLGGDS